MTDDTVDVPVRALVRCPKKSDGAQFGLVRVVACTGCDKFGGLEDRFPGTQQRFGVRYAVRCFAEPVKREILTLAE